MSEKPYWERYSVGEVHDSSTEWAVRFDDKLVAMFYGEDAERNARDFHDFIIDPRSSTYTEGFIAGMDCWDRERDELRAAVGWLAVEQAKLCDGRSIAPDIIAEAFEEGRRIMREKREKEAQ